VNKANDVNTRPTSRSALEQALLDKIQGLVSEIGWQAEVSSQGPSKGKGIWVPDAKVLLRTREGSKAELWVEVKTEARPGAFETWAEQRRPDRSDRVAVPVLAAPTVSDRLAGVCRRAGWSWYDLAGNCRIHVPGLLHIERRGNPPVRTVRRPGANLSTPAAARVIRALLTPAHAESAWSHRYLLEQTYWHEIPKDRPVSIGLINKVVRYLRDEGFIEDAKDGGVRLRDPKGLLDAWNQAYRFDRHERRSYFTLQKGTQLEESLCETNAGGMAAYAAFSAAERQAPHVRQAKTWVYVAARYLDALVHHTEAKAVESGDNLVLLIPDDPGVFLSFDADTFVGEKRLHSTDPVQTYVDLLHCGGRGEEAAQALLDQKLLPPWKKAGLA